MDNHLANRQQPPPHPRSCVQSKTANTIRAPWPGERARTLQYLLDVAEGALVRLQEGELCGTTAPRPEAVPRHSGVGETPQNTRGTARCTVQHGGMAAWQRGGVANRTRRTGAWVQASGGVPRRRGARGQGRRDTALYMASRPPQCGQRCAAWVSRLASTWENRATKSAASGLLRNVAATLIARQRSMRLPRPARDSAR